jgi:glycosyltransferase involved in cell wall biosynthesis
VRTFLTILWRLIKFLPLLLISPALMILVILALAFTDLLLALRSPRSHQPDQSPGNSAATVVIPNWNGRDLLERYLPSVIEALAGNPANEILIVDNGSADGSAGMLRERFPSVRVLALDRNLGFGGGSNAGFRAAKNDIVVLLNSDMRVEPDFLAPLLAGFTDEKVFAVSCQIFFSDPAKLREETGLTQGWWENGGLRVRHRDDPAITDLYPCFYGGGALSTGANSWNSAASTSCFTLSTWKILTSATWRGSVAGKYCTNRTAWCITNIAEPSENDSPTNKSISS